MNLPFVGLSFLMAVANVRRAADQQAGPSVRHLSPATFALPRSVRKALEERRCTIPQSFDMAKPHNVIFGTFTERGRSEWAALCSVRDTSQILIVDTRTGGIVDSLERSADAHWIQDIGHGRLGYSRRVTLLPRNRIRRWRNDVDRRPIPQPIDHDAIQQAFVEKYAEAFYQAAGRWYKRLIAD